MTTIPRTLSEYREWWSEQRPGIPFGYCWCGCGEPTTRSPYTDRPRRYFKNEPFRYVSGHQRRGHPTAHTVEDRGHDTPCWVWQRAKNENGYGTTKVGRRTVKAHRLYYELHIGPIPEGMSLDHLCRNVACVRPSHLEPVSHAENVRRGNAAKLCWADVHEIRRLHGISGITNSQIAQQFGIHVNYVREIATGKRWKATTQSLLH